MLIRRLVAVGLHLHKRYMRRIATLLVLFSFMGLQLSGCASFHPNFSSKADMGIFGGSISGVIIGGLVGSIPGALLGGMIGLAAGDLVGEHYDKKLETREEALRKHQLKDMEEKLVLEGSSVDPLHAAVGSTVKTSVRYTVVAPAEVKEIRITETRMLYSEKAGYLKLDERQVRRTQGTYSSMFKFIVPEKMSRGDSVIITVISNDRQTEKISSHLNIV